MSTQCVADMPTQCVGNEPGRFQLAGRPCPPGPARPPGGHMPRIACMTQVIEKAAPRKIDTANRRKQEGDLHRRGWQSDGR